MNQGGVLLLYSPYHLLGSPLSEIGPIAIFDNDNGFGSQAANSVIRVLALKL